MIWLDVISFFKNDTILKAYIHPQQTDALGDVFEGDEMEHRFDSQEIGEVEAADEFSGPFVDVGHTGVVCKQTEIGSFEGIFSAKAAEVLTNVVASESMTVSSQQGEFGRECLLCVCPCRGTFIRIDVRAASQEIVAASVAIFRLSQSTQAITIRAKAEYIVTTREIVISHAVVQRRLKAQVFVVIGIMEAYCCFWKSANVRIPGNGGENAARAVGEKRKSVAAEIVLVGATDAGEKGMTFA